MFSGIVSALGTVATGPRPTSGALVLRHQALADRLRAGQSLAVNGCCLTVVGAEAGELALDVMPETLRRTNLGRLQSGDRVNLEPALALGDPVGGHLVQGHVEAVGEVLVLNPEGNALWLELAIPEEVARYCVTRGSIAVDGCSLTLVTVEDHPSGDARARIALVPETLRATIASAYRKGSLVNLEADPLARLVERLLSRRAAAPVARREGLG